MNIALGTQPAISRAVLAPARTESLTFGPEIDPIGSVGRKISDVFTSTTDFAGKAIVGAVPGYGAYKNFGAAISKGFSGNNAGTKVAFAGSLANAAGTIGLGAALLTGSSVVMQGSAALLIGSGIAHGYAG